MDVIGWFEYLWRAFWSWLDGIQMFESMSARDLFVGFIVMSAILGFIFKKVAPSGD